MAEVTSSRADSRWAGRKIRSGKMSTRIDFTPMVDLGFLLVSFFMLTTVLAKPQIMALVVPDKKSDEKVPLKQSQVLTLILGKNDKVYYYEGITDPRLDSTTFFAGGLRRVILEKRQQVKAQFGEESYVNSITGEICAGSHLNVLIKPSRESRYKNLVDVLDEMTITGVRRYVLLDLSDCEKAFLENPAGGLQGDPYTVHSSDPD